MRWKSDIDLWNRIGVNEERDRGRKGRRDGGWR